MNDNKERRPKVGLSVFIRKDGKVLLMLRKGSHGSGTWAPPGGHLEYGESWEECAKREILEEVGVETSVLRFITATNDIFGDEGKHYITLFFVADWISGEARNLELDKCEKVDWFFWNELPEPLFLCVRNFLKTGYNPLTI